MQLFLDRQLVGSLHSSALIGQCVEEQVMEEQVMEERQVGRGNGKHSHTL